MGSHFLFIAVKGDNAKAPVELLKTIGYPDAKKIDNPKKIQTSLFRGGSDYVHIGESAGWTLIWGNLFPPLSFYDSLTKDEFERYKDFEFLETGFKQVSAKSKGLACVIESTSGSYGYDWYVKGQLVRRYWETEGLPYKQYGEILPGEDEVLSVLKKDENAILLLVEKLVIPPDDIDELHYEAFEILWPEPKKRSRFKFW